MSEILSFTQILCLSLRVQVLLGVVDGKLEGLGRSQMLRQTSRSPCTVQVNEGAGGQVKNVECKDWVSCGFSKAFRVGFGAGFVLSVDGL